MENSTSFMSNETQECNHNEAILLLGKKEDIQIMCVIKSQNSVVDTAQLSDKHNFFLHNSFTVVNCIICPIGIICNLLSIVVLVQKSLRNVFHDLLLSLAFYDLLYLALRLCFVVAEHMKHG